MGNICCVDDSNETKFSAVDKKRASTLTPNIKNFKQLKTIKDIKSLYDMQTVLGKGSFGSVYKATNLKTNNLYAVKMIGKDKISQNPVLDNLMISELQML